MVFNRKQIIEDLEADLTGAPKQASNNDDVDLAEVSNANEDITAEAKASNEIENDLKEEQNKKSYKETMKIDIENINTIEKRHKVYIQNDGGLSTKLYNKLF